MSAISAAAVRALRDRTDMPMMECKAALEEAKGDVEQAVLILRKQGKKFQDKKGDRETAEGRIATFVDLKNQVGAILELRCESPSVVKNDIFVKLGTDLVKQIALKNPASVEELLSSAFVDNPAQTVNDRIAEAIGLIRENMKIARFHRLTGICGEYVHHDGGTGVLLSATGDAANCAILRDVCMHVVAARPIPVSTRRDDVPAEIVARETQLAKEKAMATGKPANIAEKIAEGQMKAWFAENVLVEQPFIRDPEKTVGQVVKSAGLEIVTFVRMRVGEVI